MSNDPRVDALEARQEIETRGMIRQLDLLLSKTEIPDEVAFGIGEWTRLFQALVERQFNEHVRLRLGVPGASSAVLVVAKMPDGPPCPNGPHMHVAFPVEGMVDEPPGDPGLVN